MKILFTSVGRRVELMQRFRQGAQNLGINLEIHGADMSDTAPALCFCDKTLTPPRIKTDEYIPFLIDYCRKNRIDALIPTIDTDLYPLSLHKQDFGATKVLVSNPEMVAICRDKRKTAGFLNGIGLCSPVPVDDVRLYDGPFPAFIKPRDGSSSISCYKVENESMLEKYASSVPDYIIQPFIEGTEYTVDILCDLSGRPILITPRIRLAVRSGEVLKTQIRQDDGIIADMKKLIDVFKPTGQITVQLIKQKDTGINYYIEINPRFGGGAPISMLAGADSASCVLRILSGEQLDYYPKAARDGNVYSRFDQTVLVKTVR